MMTENHSTGLHEALEQEMRRDPRVIVIGEDVRAGPGPGAAAMPPAGCSASPRG